MRRLTVSATAAILALGLAGAALSQTKEATPMTETTTLAREAGTMEQAIAAFLKAGPQGARLPLSEVAAFDWDTVHPFQGVVSRDLYQRVLGDTAWLDDPALVDAQDESVRLVFLKAGKVVGTALLTPPVWLLGVREQPMGRDAALVVTSPDPGPYSHLALE